MIQMTPGQKEVTSRLWFLARRKWVFWLSICGIVATVVAAVIWPSLAALWIVLLVLSLAGGVVPTAVDYRVMRREERDLYVAKLAPELLDEIKLLDRYREYVRMPPFGGQRLLYSKKVNRLAGRARTQLELMEDAFEVRGQAKRVEKAALDHARAKGALVHNDRKLRLVTDLTPELLSSGKPATIQRTDYFSGIFTNEMACCAVRSRREEREVFKGMDLVSNNGIMLDLCESPCSNHIGVATIAFTRDGNLVLLQQSAKSAQSPNRTMPSGAGSVDYEDIEGCATLQDVVLQAMNGELAEECGLIDGPRRTEEIPPGIVVSRIIGYARHLNRGGKPEFYGVSFMDCGRDRVHVTRGEAVFISDIIKAKVGLDNIGDLRRSLARVRDEHKASASVVLWANLKFLDDCLENSRTEFIEAATAFLREGNVVQDR